MVSEEVRTFNAMHVTLWFHSGVFFALVYGRSREELIFPSVAKWTRRFFELDAFGPSGMVWHIVPKSPFFFCPHLAEFGEFGYFSSRNVLAAPSHPTHKSVYGLGSVGHLKNSSHDFLSNINLLDTIPIHQLFLGPASCMITLRILISSSVLGSAK